MDETTAMAGKDEAEGLEARLLLLPPEAAAEEPTRCGGGDGGGGGRKRKKTYLDVLGVCCSAEVALVERLLAPLDGVRVVSVVAASRTVVVEHDPAAAPESAIGKPPRARAPLILHAILARDSH